MPIRSGPVCRGRALISNKFHGCPGILRAMLRCEQRRIDDPTYAPRPAVWTRTISAHCWLSGAALSLHKTLARLCKYADTFRSLNTIYMVTLMLPSIYEVEGRRICQRRQFESLQDLVRRSPASGRGVLLGGGTKHRQQADIQRTKELHVEYKKRKRLAVSPSEIATKGRR